MSKYAVIKGYLKHSRIDFNIFDEPHKVQAAVSFNMALVKVMEFIDTYEQGVLPKEFLDGLIEKSEEK